MFLLINRTIIKKNQYRLLSSRSQEDPNNTQVSVFRKSSVQLRTHITRNFTRLTRKDITIYIDGDDRQISSRSWAICFIDEPFEYKGIRYHGIGIPLFGITAIRKLLKNEDSITRKTVDRHTKGFSIGTKDSVLLELDLLSLIDRFKLYFSIEAFESFQFNFEQLLLKYGEAGKNYMPCFQMDEWRLSPTKNESFLNILIKKNESEQNKKIENDREISYTSLVKPFSVYVSLIRTDTKTGKSHFYIGSSEAGSLPRNYEKRVRAGRFLLEFHKKKEAPIWEKETRLEGALQLIIAQARFDIGETTSLDFNAISRCGELGFSTALTENEIVHLCLRDQECYQNYNLMSILELRNLNKKLQQSYDSNEKE